MRKLPFFIYFIIIVSGLTSLYLINKEYEKHKEDLSIIAAKRIESNKPESNPLKTELPKNAPVREFDIVVTDSEYSPNIIRVNRGDVVKISLHSKEGYHNFQILNLGIRSKLLTTGKKDEFTFVATISGVFDIGSNTYFLYKNHPGGQLIVE